MARKKAIRRKTLRKPKKSTSEQLPVSTPVLVAAPAPVPAKKGLWDKVKSLFAKAKELPVLKQLIAVLTIAWGLVVKVYKVFSSIPAMLGYNSEHRKKYGMKSFHFWYREFFHLIGGAIIYFLLTFFLPGWKATMLIMGGICAKEYVEFKFKGQPLDKSILDPLFWLLGVALAWWRLGA